MEQQIGVIIVAGGGGTRMGGSRPKQFTMLGGLPVLAHTINNFAGALPGAEIVVVLPAAHADFWKDFAARFDIAAHTVTTGGDERFHSVKNGFSPAVFRESHDASVISSKSVVNNPAIRFIYRVILCNFAIADGGGIFDASAQRCKVSNL